jgi:hypothetical protein
MPKTNRPEDVFKFIDTKNNDPSKCWPWTGVLGGRDGRGYISINNVKKAAHRVVYELFNGPIPEGQVIRHECDNPRCCNPEHLVVGTRTDNELDKYKRGRAGVPLHIVNEILRLQREATRNGVYITNQQIADQVNSKYDTRMVASTVSRILSGKTRKAQKEEFENDGNQ